MKKPWEVSDVSDFLAAVKRFEKGARSDSEEKMALVVKTVVKKFIFSIRHSNPQKDYS